MADFEDDLESFFGDDSNNQSVTPQKNENKQRQDFEDDIYKKWFRSKDRSGFLTLRHWFEAGKVSIDVGELSGEGLKGNTQVWTNAIALGTYLRSVTNGTAALLYPAQRGTSAEAFVYYGGGKIDGRPVSRILKVEHWSTGSGENRRYDESAFAWKCGHFVARQTDSGAYIPDMSQSLSQNSIRVTRTEMAEMSYRLDIALHSFAARTDDVMRALNGNRQ